MAGDRPRHIFIVEDNEIYSMMLDYILSKDSMYRFVSFKSGEECIKNLYLRPDVIILDYGLPGMNGYETLLEIKKYDPAIHVVMLTTHREPGLEKKLLEAGADDFVQKQGHGELQVIQKIEAILAHDRMEKELNERSFSFLGKFFQLLVALLAVLFLTSR